MSIDADNAFAARLAFLSHASLNQLVGRARSARAGLLPSWVEAATCTKPADRDRAERAMATLYERRGRKPRFVWCGSPLSLVATAQRLSAPLYPPKIEIHEESVRADIERAFREGMPSVSRSIGDVLFELGLGHDLTTSALLRDSGANEALDFTHPRHQWNEDQTSLSRKLLQMHGIEEMQRLAIDKAAETQYRTFALTGLQKTWAFRLAVYLAIYDNAALNTACEPVLEVARSCSMVLAYPTICFFAERPSQLSLRPPSTGGEPHLHADDGYAIAYPDGWGIEARRGLFVDPAWRSPGGITPKMIQDEPNLERQNLMAEIYGFDKFVIDSGASVLHEDVDTYGRRRRLLSAPLRSGGRLAAENVTMVEVQNGTAEPDGSRKTYYLRVHPDLRPIYADGRLGPPQQRTCHNAVASTFGMLGSTYQPTVET